MNDVLKNEEARPDMDNLLHEYFQAELPRPWPTFHLPRSERKNRPASLWSRYSGRIALAACIALLAAGYLTLAGYFPRMTAPTGVEQVSPDVGQLPKDKGAKPTPVDNR